MIFPNQYKILPNISFSSKEFSLVPIRYEDRVQIMQWRNEQIYHLRQKYELSSSEQDNYFQTTLRSLFDKECPDQLLFSFLKDGQLLGYGGLVHINWTDKHAEISFLLNTAFSKELIREYWLKYLSLIHQVSIACNLHKIYTYAFDVRPWLYSILEDWGMAKEAVLESHCRINGEWKNVVIHRHFVPEISIRKAVWEDRDIILQWANDEETRKFSFDSTFIAREEHYAWYERRLTDPNTCIYICETNNEPSAVVRFELKNADYIISINVNPEFRKQKLSFLMLYSSIRTFEPKKSILAYIKKNNLASAKIFEKCGFKLDAKERIEYQDSIVLKFNPHE